MNAIRVASAAGIAVLCSLSATVPSAQAASGSDGSSIEQASALVQPSVVYLETTWSAFVNDGEDWLPGDKPYSWTSRCTGFVVSQDGYVATAGHCVDPGAEGARKQALRFAVDTWFAKGWAKPGVTKTGLLEHAVANWKVEGRAQGSPPDRTVSVQQGAATSGLRTGQAVPARVVEVNPPSQGDVALLKIEKTDLMPVQLAPSSEVTIGSEVLSVGYPASTDDVTDASYTPTFKDGRINAKKTREGGLLPVYEMSAAVSGGMSGGPTVDLQGRVIGLNSFKITGETEAFNYISPSSLITETLSRNGVRTDPGPLATAYAEGVRALFASDYQTALARFDTVLAEVPSHEQAQELRKRARAGVDAHPAPAAAAPGDAVVRTAATTREASDRSGAPVGLILVVALAGLLALAATVGRARVRPVLQAARRSTSDTGPAVAEPVPPAGSTTVAAAAVPAYQPGSTAGQPVAARLAVLAPGTRPCPACHGAQPDAARFCSDCGSALR